MRIVSLLSLLAVMFLMTGCELDFTTGIETENETVIVDKQDPYINAYVYIPVDVKEIIAGRVDGYSMPPVERYGYTLYPTDVIRDNFNLPSYVKADFNGDGYSDYAYMFSKVSYNNYEWFLDTRLIIVTSTYYGYTISTDIGLGTVSASNSTPMEEYWAIRLLKRGIHTITVNNYGIEKETEVELANDGIYLASIDPDERSVLYVDNTVTHEIVLDLGSIAKKPALSDRSTRKIKLVK